MWNVKQIRIFRMSICQLLHFYNSVCQFIHTSFCRHYQKYTFNFEIKFSHNYYFHRFLFGFHKNEIFFKWIGSKSLYDKVCSHIWICISLHHFRRIKNKERRKMVDTKHYCCRFAVSISPHTDASTHKQVSVNNEERNKYNMVQYYTYNGIYLQLCKIFAA